MSGVFDRNEYAWIVLRCVSTNSYTKRNEYLESCGFTLSEFIDNIRWNLSFTEFNYRMVVGNFHLNFDNVIDWYRVIKGTRFSSVGRHSFILDEFDLDVDQVKLLLSYGLVSISDVEKYEKVDLDTLGMKLSSNDYFRQEDFRYEDCSLDDADRVVNGFWGKSPKSRCYLQTFMRDWCDYHKSDELMRRHEGRLSIYDRRELDGLDKFSDDIPSTMDVSAGHIDPGMLYMDVDGKCITEELIGSTVVRSDVFEGKTFVDKIDGDVEYVVYSIRSCGCSLPDLTFVKPFGEAFTVYQTGRMYGRDLVDHMIIAHIKGDTYTLPSKLVDSIPAQHELMAKGGYGVKHIELLSSFDDIPFDYLNGVIGCPEFSEYLYQIYGVDGYGKSYMRGLFTKSKYYNRQKYCYIMNELGIKPGTLKMPKSKIVCDSKYGRNGHELAGETSFDDEYTSIVELMEDRYDTYIDFGTGTKSIPVDHVDTIIATMERADFASFDKTYRYKFNAKKTREILLGLRFSKDALERFMDLDVDSLASTPL